jgi:hypothetical protein
LYLEAVEDISECTPQLLLLYCCCAVPALLHTANATCCHVHDISATLTVYKLTANIEVADVEQQVQDYIRQEVRLEAGICQLHRQRSVRAAI